MNALLSLLLSFFRWHPPRSLYWEEELDVPVNGKMLASEAMEWRDSNEGDPA